MHWHAMLVTINDSSLSFIEVESSTIAFKLEAIRLLIQLRQFSLLRYKREKIGFML